MITLRGGLLSIARTTPSRASAARSIRFGVGVPLDRQLAPLLAVDLHDISDVGSRRCRLRSATGQGLWATKVLWPSASQHSSARCGIIGAKQWTRMSPASAKAARRSSPTGASLDRSDRRAELVGQLVDRGDADIEPQPLDLVLDLGQRRMGDSADAPRLVAVIRRRRRTLGADDALDLADEAPQALRLLERALDARLGPDDVALGRRVGQHEPSRRVGAVGRDDLVGIDRVALRFRHLLGRADLDRLAAVKREPRGARRRPLRPELRTARAIARPRRDRSRAPPCPG